MNEKIRKSVLVVDDEPEMCQVLRDNFRECVESSDCPFDFEVEVAGSAAECVEKIRARRPQLDQSPYDVIVLDVRMETKRTGLDTAFILALYEDLGVERPVVIVFTGYPSYPDCIEAMRYGAWDYIVKGDAEEIRMGQLVVDSAVNRLRELDQGRELESQIAALWVPNHIIDLQKTYEGKLIAIWNKPDISVIASGQDAFELEANLKEWRKEHQPWERPFIIQIPLRRSRGET